MSQTNSILTREFESVGTEPISLFVYACGVVARHSAEGRSLSKAGGVIACYAPARIEKLLSAEQKLLVTLALSMRASSELRAG